MDENIFDSLFLVLFEWFRSVWLFKWRTIQASRWDKVKGDHDRSLEVTAW